MNKSRILGTCLGLTLLAACADESTNQDYRALYESQVKKTNVQIEKYNDTLTHAQASDELFLKSTDLMNQLNAQATKILSLRDDVRRDIGQAGNDAAVSRKVETLTAETLKAEAIIAKIEKLYGKEAAAVLVDRADETMMSYAVETTRTQRRISLDLLDNLNGIRKLFLSSREDLITPVNTYLRRVALTTIVGEVEADANPVIRDATLGGSIVGSVRHATSGQALSNVQVGFKTRRESTKYFHETRTDSQGRYSSPLVRSGTYYVDYLSPGLADTRDQPVTVNRGENRNVSSSMTPPILEGQFRVVLSWTGPKNNAVTDVDSYLAIPGSAMPLNYQRQGQDYNDAFLDIDDTTWEGPETTTIRKVRAGTYRYYVNNYSNTRQRDALGNSEVRVQLFKGANLLKVYTVPAGTGITYEVFRINEGRVEDVEKYDDSLATSSRGY